MPSKAWGTMKLAVKYDVEMLRTLITRHLESEWPLTFSDWERDWEWVRPQRGGPPESPETDYGTTVDPPRSVSA